MKRLLLLATFCCSIFSLSSQVIISGGGTVPPPPSSGNIKVTEKKAFDATIRCYYTFSQTNKETLKVIRVDTMALLIGESLSKFYNPVKQARDSIYQSVMTNLKPEMIRSISILKNQDPDEVLKKSGETTSTGPNDGESYQIIKTRAQNSLSYFDYVDVMGNGELYRYTDNLGQLPWNIENDTASILGYNCKKATLKFRGRSFIAWFSMDIPINDGPWKFMGLPGLILKINDDANLFCFELVGIENLETALKTQIPNSKFDCNQKELEKLKKKQTGGMAITVNSGDVTISSTNEPYNYNPIELNP